MPRSPAAPPPHLHVLPVRAGRLTRGAEHDRVVLHPAPLEAPRYGARRAAVVPRLGYVTAPLSSAKVGVPVVVAVVVLELVQVLEAQPPAAPDRSTGRAPQDALRVEG